MFVFTLVFVQQNKRDDFPNLKWIIIGSSSPTDWVRANVCFFLFFLREGGRGRVVLAIFFLFFGAKFHHFSAKNIFKKIINRIPNLCFPVFFFFFFFVCLFFFFFFFFFKEFLFSYLILANGFFLFGGKVSPFFLGKIFWIKEYFVTNSLVFFYSNS